MRLRRHQREALAALDGAWASGRTRAWVALPPGAGKTLVGLETVRALVAEGRVDRAVVLGPNTAIQGQWAASAARLGLDVGTTRALEHTLTALTYQSIAVFDDDAADPSVVEEGAQRPSRDLLTSRLHPNGRAVLDRLRSAGPLLLVLDECHHLLEVWGRLLAELLAELPDAVVLGLTATPPDALTADQALLVDELFGVPLYAASIPAVVKEGDLAPFVELAWLTTPTPGEDDWLAQEAERFAELVAQLTAPGFGSMPFLAWLDARFVADRAPWLTLLREEPDLARAVLRLHHAGLIARPEGARLTEEHRTRPTADDWVLLIEDWLTGRLTRTGLPEDEAVVEAVRRALPSVGYQWTRTGIRRGRSPVDRVLARSESKTTAVVEICAHEHATLGERLRMLVLCDHERAGATLPADLTGVLDQQSGSAHAMLAALVAAPDTAGLRPVLVTGRTVAGAPETLADLLAWLPDRALADSLRIEPGAAFAQVLGPWSSRDWVAHVTAYFQEGRCRVLVGTRGLLGEGWDAPRITGLADATAVTTSTAVVQTRGRALRVDPQWADKVAITWSLVCVSERHPKGGNDWDRLVRKHAGWFGLDPDGAIVDGVAHLDPAFSPYAPLPVAELGAANARAVVRSQDRDLVREQWRIGEPYDDTTVPVVRIRSSRVGAGDGPVEVVLRSDAADLRGRRPAPLAAMAAVGVGVAVVAAVIGAPVVVAAGVLAGLAAAVGAVRRRATLLRAAGEAPSVLRIASAVADGLHAAGLTRAGATAVEVVLDAEGEYRCALRHVPTAEAEVFATALDEAVSPMGLPRYVLPRHVRTRGWRLRADGVVWHAVPTVLGTNTERAAAYARAWDHWVGGGEPVYTGSPEGQGVLAAQQGTDPFAASTVMRRQWS